MRMATLCELEGRLNVLRYRMNRAPALHCPSLAIQEVVPHLGQTLVGGIWMGNKPAGHFAILHLSFTCLFIANCQEKVRAVSIMAMHT